MSAYDGTPVKHVSHGKKSLDRDSITTGHVKVPMRWYHTSCPTIFAGFQVNWIDGNDNETGATFGLSSGAGFGSKYMTLRVDVPGHDPIYEYVDVVEILQQRVETIIDEVTGGHDG